MEEGGGSRIRSTTTGSDEGVNVGGLLASPLSYGQQQQQRGGGGGFYHASQQQPQQQGPFWPPPQEQEKQEQGVYDMECMGDYPASASSFFYPQQHQQQRPLSPLMAHGHPHHHHMHQPNVGPGGGLPSVMPRAFLEKPVRVFLFCVFVSVYTHTTINTHATWMDI